MKNILKIAVLSPLFLVSVSCENDFLDRQPLKVTLDDIEQGGIVGQVFGIYGMMRSNEMSILPPMTIEYFRDDDSMKGSSLSDGRDYEVVADEFNYTKAHWFTESYWSKHYEMINQVNNALKIVEDEGFTDENTLQNVGEAKFFRAFAYFNLVRCYGDVPLIDFPIKSAAEANIPKSTAAQVLALVDKDLEDAASVLPESWGSAYVGRLTKGSANTLRAKVALWNKDFPKALAMSEQVINSGQYKLMDKYFQIFQNEGENGSESIWELQFDFFTSGQTTYGSDWATSQGIRDPGIPEWNLGWGWNVPTESLVAAYEPGDPRKNSTILFSGQSDDPTWGGYGRILPGSRQTTPAGPLERKYWNKKVYVDEAYKKANGFNTWQANWVNKRMLRYADVLLMAAEAANETGNGAKAEQYLEEVRKRARHGNTAILPKVVFKDQSQMRTAIKHERRVELAMEGSRFYDLVRWGDATAVLGPQGYTNRHRYMPIPQIEIDKSNGVLVQNPEW
jgi:hypothetical protein